MLEVTGIDKAYGGRRVLGGASLTLEPGQCLGLVGQNGSGKSTLMRIIAQIIPPDGGAIREDGRSVLGNRAFLRQKLGYVPQEDALAPFLTVEGQLRFWQGAVGASCSEAVEALGLTELGKKRISALSGGQRKRVSIALALQNTPKYLVMDEAFSGLDETYRDVLAALVARALDRGASVLWCSHDRAEIARLCRRCCVLREGRLTLLPEASVL